MATTTAQAFETRRVVVISWTHLTVETVLTLKSAPLAAWPVLGGPIGPDMLMVCAHSEVFDMPDDIATAIRWARAQTSAPGCDDPNDPGFEYILFDRDADARDDLPVYDHG